MSNPDVALEAAARALADLVGRKNNIGLSELARAAIAAYEKAAWRPLEEYSPGKDQEWVFLFVPGHGPARARWNGRSWMSHTNARQITRGTHFRPLPLPPEVE